MTFRSQPDRMTDPEFRESSKKFADGMQMWWDLETQEHIEKIKTFEAAEMRHVFITDE